MDPRGALARARTAARRLVRPSDPAGPVPPASVTPPRTPPAVPVVARLTDAHWTERQTLALAGWVHLTDRSATASHRPRLEVRFEDSDGATVAAAAVRQQANGLVNEAADDATHDHSGSAFTAEVDLRELLGTRDHGPWFLTYVLHADASPLVGPFTERDLHGPAGQPLSSGPVDGSVLVTRWHKEGGLRVRRRSVEEVDSDPAVRPDLGARVRALAVSVDAVAATLTVTGSAPTDSSTDLVLELRGSRQVTRVGVRTDDAGAFLATLPLVNPDWYGDPRPLVSDVYFLTAVTSTGEAHEVCLDPAAVPTIGRFERGTQLHARVERTRSNAVRLRVDPPLRDDERGAFAQMQLRRDYHAMPPLAEQQHAVPTAYYECYYGVSTTDSARALHDELVSRGTPVRHVWGVADLSVPVPDGSEAVLRHSREWWQVLGCAAYLTFNAGLPPGLVRRPGQVLVQTWHGTPLKLLGHDRPVNHDKPGFAESTRRYVSRWDHLLAGNPHSAAAFRSAWFYEGSVLELGYPRNDVLARPDPAHARRVRQRLGIDPRRTVVLYAPTWREGQRVMPELLDLDRLSELLGPDHVFLVRGHMNITRWQSRPEGSAVIDVTSYPEINDLFLVADVAVTDYSSIMFDYSVTRKPMLFFVPDLEDYRDRRRGVYFDLAESAPGPLLATTDEVAAALRDLDPAQHAERYAAWVGRFNPLDDGHAAARVVDAVYRFDAAR